QTTFERRLDRVGVAQSCRPAYYKWIRFYLYFCQKFGYPATAPTALGPFLTKLADKKHSIEERHQAATAVTLLLRYDLPDHKLYLELSAPSPLPEPQGADSRSGSTLPRLASKLRTPSAGRTNTVTSKLESNCATTR